MFYEILGDREFALGIILLWVLGMGARSIGQGGSRDPPWKS